MSFVPGMGTTAVGGATALRELLDRQALVRAMGVHDGLTAILAERAGFEAVWAGGLGICTAHGVPDAGLLTMTELLRDAGNIRRVTGLPVIADVDSGFGDVNVVQRMIRLYEEAGIAAVCIEDKEYPKRNSFREGNVLADADEFARKVHAAKAAQRGSDFVVIARLESLIVGAGQDDALRRARTYLDAGADALLIHSRARTVDEVAEFTTRLRRTAPDVPVFVVPTTYYTVRAGELGKLGINGVIYANHVMRATVRTVTRVLQDIAAHGSTACVEDDIAGVPELFDLVGTDRLLDDVPWTGLLATPEAGS